MIVKYWDKMKHSKVIYLGVWNKRDLSWFQRMFNFYIKINKVPRKEDFESAFIHRNFKYGISKECQEMIKENYKKFYPK